MVIHLVVALERVAEEERIDFLLLGISGEARVENGGLGLDEKNQRGGVVCIAGTEPFETGRIAITKREKS